jgi:RNA-binding protein
MGQANPELQGFQRRHLRALAHPLQPLVQIGQSGVTDAVVEAAAQALSDHELIKVRMREPEDKHSMAAELARRLGAHLVGLVGHTVILYRANPEKPVIQLPTRRSGGKSARGRGAGER